MSIFLTGFAIQKGTWYWLILCKKLTSGPKGELPVKSEIEKGLNFIIELPQNVIY